jgi:hypothetical protein
MSLNDGDNAMHLYDSRVPFLFSTYGNSGFMQSL